MAKIVFSFFLIVFYSCILSAQNVYRQTIRGIVIDKQSQQPLSGANVVVTDVPGLIVSTDSMGEFHIYDVPVGRQNIKVSFVGYYSYNANNVLVYSGKEVVLRIELEEQVNKLEEIVVSYKVPKDKPLNEMAMVSARAFSIEETNRYAGSLGDPARMAMNYAGVMSTGAMRNDIIIRGNSPMGLLWRLDGVEISNPNHFGSMGSTGGPVTILNNNLLTNSDFYTGAFPAEFGNAISGAFDLKMRAGNNERREYWLQTGWNGFELGAEGPFSKNHKASYLFTYRYSYLDLMDKLNMIGKNVLIPQYQDLTFKIDVPLNGNDKLSAFGIGGISRLDDLESRLDKNYWLYKNHGQDLVTKSKIGVAALSYLHFLNNKTRIITSASVNFHENTNEIDTFANVNNKANWYGADYIENKYSFSTKIITKLDAKNTTNVGVIFDYYDVNYNDSVSVNDRYIELTNSSANMLMPRVYTQWLHIFNEKWIITSGLYSQYLIFNNSFSIEPRFGLKWKVSANKSVSLGYGLHSQINPKLFYFTKTQNPDTASWGTSNENFTTNKNLGFMKSHHFVVGYDQLIAENLRIKFEGYYQYLFNIPVKKTLPAYSVINSGDDYYISPYDSLVNKGSGRNYGLELTFEKFFARNYYFLVTTSLFESKYRGYDKIERNTAFNGNYVINLLGGYEFKVGAKSSLYCNVKSTFAGGKRVLPFDVPSTIANGIEKYDWNNAYEHRNSDYKCIDLSLGLRKNFPKFSMEYTLMIQNLTNQHNVIGEGTINVKTGKIKRTYQVGFLPIINWKVMFK